MAQDKTQFLKFNAYSIKDLITRKLTENSKFTDQVYKGSNLAILIDLVSYMYQCLMYQLNNAASESMFSDTQIYENINRLVSLLGYNPRGCYPATMNVYVESDKTNVNIQPYSYFDTGLTDSRGGKIFYSFATDDQNTDQMEDGIAVKTCYNGIWKLYPTIFTASGTESETFNLSIGSNRDTQQYIPGDFVDVYVDRGGKIQRWTRDDDGVFANTNNVSTIDVSNTTIYGKSKTIFGIRLTEDKTYEIKFGTGIIGSKLQAGDRVIIVYLDTNGPDGQIDISDVNFDTLQVITPGVEFGLNSDIMSQIVGEVDQHTIQLSPLSRVVTNFKYEEDVEDIRINGPSWFKLGNRLITRSDYEYFIKENNSAKECFDGRDIVDVKCMNNIEYVSSFYKWLYQMGLNGQRQNLTGFTDGGRHYFNQQFWQRTDYKYIDPADANNTYIWVKTGDMERDDWQDQYDVRSSEIRLNNVLQPMKTLTTEIQVVKPVIVNFDICAANDYSYIRSAYMNDNQTVIDEGCESYIELTLDDNTLYVNTMIQQTVYDIITKSFNVNTCSLGQNMTYTDMLNKIYQISGIERVRTVFKPNNTSMLPRVVDGLSFVSWSPILNDGYGSNGVDIDVSNTSRHLEDFQFPRFVGRDYLMNRIKIIKKSLVTVNTIKM